MGKNEPHFALFARHFCLRANHLQLLINGYFILDINSTEGQC